MNKIIIRICFFFHASILLSQPFVGPETIVNRYHSWLGGLNTDGWGLGYEYGFGKQQGNHSYKFIGLEITERKHPKEDKIGFQNQSSGTFSIAYGKKNIAYPIHFYFGKMYELGTPNQVDGLTIKYFIRGGLSIALMRPYYILFFDTSSNPNKNQSVSMAYNQKDSLLFFNSDYYLNTTYLEGFNRLNLIFGGHVNTGIDFEFGVEKIIGVRANVGLEWYTNTLEIMVAKPNLINNNFFINGKLSVYIAIHNSKSKK